MLILNFLFLFHFSNAEIAEVSTPYGRVLGSLRNTSKLTPFYSFQGLPFAAPPVGNLRLLPPQPPSSWDSPLDLTGKFLNRFWFTNRKKISHSCNYNLQLCLIVDGRQSWVRYFFKSNHYRYRYFTQKSNRYRYRYFLPKK